MSSQPIVFSHDWMAEMDSRYQRLPTFQWPQVYRVATDADLADIRTKVEEWVRILPADAREKLVPRLRDSKQFANTYHELATGQVLRDSGYRVEYERKLGGQTPDWCVLTSDGFPLFLVEAVSCNTPAEQLKNRRGWHHLYQRLRQIPVGVWVEPEVGEDDPSLTTEDAARVAKGVRSWLRQNVPQVGVVIESSGTRLRIIDVDESFGKVLCVPPTEGFWVDSSRLREAISEKAKKYAELCKAEGLPLVVSVVASFATGLDADDFDQVLYGTVAYRVRPSSDPIPFRMHEGLFFRYPHLAAVLSVRREADRWARVAFESPEGPNSGHVLHPSSGPIEQLAAHQTSDARRTCRTLGASPHRRSLSAPQSGGG